MELNDGGVKRKRRSRRRKSSSKKTSSKLPVYVKHPITGEFMLKEQYDAMMKMGVNGMMNPYSSLGYGYGYSPMFDPVPYSSTSVIMDMSGMPNEANGVAHLPSSSSSSSASVQEREEVRKLAQPNDQNFPPASASGGRRRKKSSASKKSKSKSKAKSGAKRRKHRKAKK